MRSFRYFKDNILIVMNVTEFVELQDEQKLGESLYNDIELRFKYTSDSGMIHCFHLLKCKLVFAIVVKGVARRFRVCDSIAALLITTIINLNNSIAIGIDYHDDILELIKILKWVLSF